MSAWSVWDILYSQDGARIIARRWRRCIVRRVLLPRLFVILLYIALIVLVVELVATPTLLLGQNATTERITRNESRLEALKERVDLVDSRQIEDQRTNVAQHSVIEARLTRNEEQVRGATWMLGGVVFALLSAFLHWANKRFSNGKHVVLPATSNK